MTQEDIQLLLTDLCARLPYGVKGLALGGKIDSIKTLSPTEYPWVKTSSGLSCHLGTGQFKPYLRPMSSMTEEERKIYAKQLFADLGGVYEDYYKALDYLNSLHIDYRGLIEKGLAIAVTKENNPYKD